LIRASEINSSALRTAFKAVAGDRFADILAQLQEKDNVPIAAEKNIEPGFSRHASRLTLRRPG
jgi:hypothetical protein